MAVLSPADHEKFITDGYVVVRNAVPEAVLAPAVALLNEKHNDVDVTGVEDFKQNFGETTQACYTDRILDAIGELFGPELEFPRRRCGVDMSRPYHPEKADQWSLDGGGGAHTDHDYPTIMPDSWAVGMFIFLTQVRSRGGAFLIAPGSPNAYRALMLRGPTAHTFGEGRFLQVRSGRDDYRARPLQEFLAQPGDALLFHHLMGHSGSENVSDPQTRHALLSRHAPYARIRPAGKSFESMSTIEKANCVAYLRHRFGDDFTPASVSDGARLAVGRDVRCAAAFRFAGRTHLWLGGDGPRVRRLSTIGFSDWVEDAPFDTGLPSVDSVALMPVFEHMLAAVAGRDRTQLYRTQDLTSWELVGAVPDAPGGSLFTTGSFATRTAEGMHLTCGSERITAPSFELLAKAQRARLAPDGARDSVLHAVCGEGDFAVVGDVGQGLAYVRSADGASFDGRWQPLDAPAGAGRLRVWERARRFWLVTYVRGGAARFGTIDWDDEPVRLDEIDTPASMRAALEVVGLA